MCTSQHGELLKFIFSGELVEFSVRDPFNLVFITGSWDLLLDFFDAPYVVFSWRITSCTVTLRCEQLGQVEAYVHARVNIRSKAEGNVLLYC